MTKAGVIASITPAKITTATENAIGHF